ncbi:hypothetical protein AB3X94_37265 [Paraburkholderia sp. BR10923]|uniref:hypothetical protein n=1 Tax=Paraburkholderia sp. BR10923 TaxID=3236992 RepID=UPI0034CF564A
MADPKGRGESAPAMVYVQNTGKQPLVIPGVPHNIELAAGRITPVDATVWAKFKESAFGKHWVDEGTLTETTEDEHAEQPETEVEKADREEAEGESENVASRRRGKKRDAPQGDE